MNRIILSLILLIATSRIVYSQMELPEYEKKILSPQISLMKQYGEYPVDLAHGLVDISIPLYEIKTQSLSLPLKISFHASGLRSSEREGSLGLRWVLNAGGFVSRDVKGYADEKYPFVQGLDAYYTPSWMTLYGTTKKGDQEGNNAFINSLGFLDSSYLNVHGDYKDTEYDIFSYQLPTGKSGKFLLKDSAGVKIPCFMPYEPFNVKFYQNYSDCYHAIEITDENGILYRFGSTLANPNKHYSEGDDDNITVGWHLNSIISENKQDTILLDYIFNSGKSATAWRDVVQINDNLHENSYFDGTGVSWLYYFLSNDLIYDYINEDSGYVYQSYWPLGLSKIKFKGGSIDFMYSTADREMFLSIIDINLKDQRHNSIKKVKFNISDAEGQTFDYLNSVEFLDSLGIQKEIFRFDYYGLNQMPLKDEISKNSDWWGYYRSNTARYILEEEVSIYRPDNCGNSFNIERFIGQGDYRDSNEEDTKIGMIKSIQYPTGGETVFEYESNYYVEYNSGKFKNIPCGGLRIKSIKNTYEKGKNELRSFEYSGGNMPEYLKLTMNTKNFYDENELDCYFRDKTINPPEQQGPGYGKYTIRTFSGCLPKNYLDFYANVFYYEKITEYEGTIENNKGKIIYYYNENIPSSDYYNFNYNVYKYNQPKLYISPKDFWRGGGLIGKELYKNNCGTYSLVKKNIYNYESFVKEHIYDLPVFQFRNHFTYTINSADSKKDSERKELELIYMDSNILDIFGYKNQEYIIGAEKLTKELEYIYNDNGTVVSNQKNIYYDSNEHMFPTSLVYSDSKGNNRRTQFKYPCDFTNKQVYSSLVRRNNISPVIEKSEYSDTIFLNSIRTNYDYFNDDTIIIAPSCIEIINGQNLNEGRINFNEYDDKGNVLSVSKDNDIEVSYIWGYNQVYPVVKIEGKAYSDIDQRITATITGHTFSNSSTHSYVVNDVAWLKTQLSTLIIDKTCMVTFYTYAPLIGMTSQTDPNGITTYYEYDGFGRLKHIKDKDGNILQKYDYHYKESAGN